MRNMRLRDWAALFVGGWAGQKVMLKFLNKVLPRS